MNDCRRWFALCLPLGVVLGLSLGACGSRVTPYEQLSASGGVLAATFDAAHERLVDDYPSYLGPSELRLRRGGRRHVEVPVEVGWCYAFFAVAEDTLLDLDLWATRPNGREASRDEMLDATPLLLYCSDWSEPLTVTIDAARGRGRVAFGVLRKPD
ncbi:MAG: hypothetical protein ACI81R_001082 [Bradymonadia bacterium]|jgi:hypothetical protein